MNQSPSATLFGQLLVGLEILTPDQLTGALCRRHDQQIQWPLGEYLVAEGLVSIEDLQRVERAAARHVERQAGAEVGSPGGQAPLPEQPTATEPAAQQTATAPAISYRPGVTLEELLRQAAAIGANDLHLHSGANLKVRLDGLLHDASAHPIPAELAGQLIDDLLDEAQRAELAEFHQIDFLHSIPGVGRFRANAYRQHRGLDAVFRPIPPEPPTLTDLGLPDSLNQVTRYHQGLVLLTGPAGCGKSSTMAALVDLINETRRDHIIVIEDPIEYVHRSKGCIVNQRQVGRHTETFSRALRAALREDPDVIAIGELRDLETVSLALTAAETGHLVLGTLHTNSAVRTIHRVLGVYPPDQQEQVRLMISEALVAIVSQRLLQRTDGNGRVPALEVLFNSNAIGNIPMHRAQT